MQLHARAPLLGRVALLPRAASESARSARTFPAQRYQVQVGDAARLNLRCSVQALSLSVEPARLPITHALPIFGNSATRCESMSALRGPWHLGHASEKLRRVAPALLAR